MDVHVAKHGTSQPPTPFYLCVCVYLCLIECLLDDIYVFQSAARVQHVLSVACGKYTHDAVVLKKDEIFSCMKAGSWKQYEGCLLGYGAF